MKHFRTRTMTPPQVWACLLLLLGASMAVLEENSGQGSSPKERLFGERRPIGGYTEKIEGCFDRFDSEYSLDLGRNDINNKRCQAICTDKGYALAATRNTTCYCGNDYPSVFHRVDTGLCNLPCSPDKFACFSFTCCGSTDGRFLTISWSGEQDIMLRILRQLSHDYRLNSPIFKSKIEGSLRDQVTLKLAPTTVMEGVLGPDKFLSIGDGCPAGWSLFDRWCYKTHYAESRTYQQAVQVCQAEGGELVSVTSDAENKYLSELQGGCQGWLGPRGYPMRSSPHADDELVPSNLTMLDADGGAVRQAQAAHSTGSRRRLLDLFSGLLGNTTAAGLLQSGWGGAAAGVSKPWLTTERRKRGQKHYGKLLKWATPQYRAWSTMSSDVMQHDVAETAVLGASLGQRFEQAWSEDGDDARRLQSIVVEYNDMGVYDLRADAGTDNATASTTAAKGLSSPTDGGLAPQSHGNETPALAPSAAFQLLSAAGAALQSSVEQARDALEGGVKRSTILLDPEDELLGLRADVGLRGLKSVSVIVSRNGSEVVYGPYGDKTFLGINSTVSELRPGEAATRGVFGYKTAVGGRIRGLGFQLFESRSCSRMNEMGSWVTARCYDKQAGAQPFVCEMRSGVFTPGCPKGWVPFDASCYRKGQADNISWSEARAFCHGAGGHLVAISSVTENLFVHKLMTNTGPAAGFIGHYRSQAGLQPWVWDEYWNGPPDEALQPASQGRRRGLRKRRLEQASDAASPEVDTSEPPPKCFEMASTGLWRVVSCTDRPAGSRVIMCERGAPDQACTCSALEAVDGGKQWDGPWIAHGCSCYRQMVTGGGGGRPQLTWLEAQGVCGSVGGRLVSVGSGEENEWVRGSLRSALVLGTGFVPGYLGLNNLADRERFEWTYFQNWRDEADTTHGALSPVATTMAGGGDPSLMHGESMSPERPELRQKGHCGQMGRDGKWVRASCSGQTSSCFVCKRERAGPYPNLREGGGSEQWHVDVVSRDDAYNRDGWRGPWCDDCFPAYLRHVSTNQYLCVDAQNLLFMSWARDPAWCLLTLVVHHLTGGMAVVTTHGAALFYDDGDSGQGLHVQMLKGRAAPPLSARLFHPVKEMERKWASLNRTDSSWVAVALSTDGVATFYPSHPLGQVAWRYLRLSIAAQSRDLLKTNIKECSIAVYDLTPRTVSYECHIRAPGSRDDLVSLEQEALLFFDQSTFAAPRVPLPNGRVRCENQSPSETGTCTFAYGQGLTLSRQFRANWGYTVSDVVTHRINAAPTQTALFRIPPITLSRRNKTKKLEPHPLLKKHLTKLGMDFKEKTGKPTPAPQITDVTLSVSELKEFINAFSAAYNNFYEILITKSYVETRNWQMSVPVAPRTTDTIQFWLSSENLRYRWRALFAARGGFVISVFGQPIGHHHSLGDLSYFRDLFFFIFGTYEFPYEAEIIITVNDLPGDGWPLPLPETSQGDRIRDVARNGQIGFGYGGRQGGEEGGLGGGIFGHGHGF